jgi:hypothetical protein
LCLVLVGQAFSFGNNDGHFEVGGPGMTRLNLNDQPTLSLWMKFRRTAVDQNDSSNSAGRMAR